MKVRALSNSDLDASALGRWNDLLARSGGFRFFADPIWCKGMWEARQITPILLEVTDGDALVGLWPLALHRGGSGRRWLCPIDQEITDYVEPIIDPRREQEATAAMLEFAVGERGSWDSVAFANVAEDSIVATEAARLATSGHSAPFLAVPFQRCPLIDLPATYGELLERRGHRRKIEARTRALGREGVRIALATESEGERLGDIFLKLHLQRADAKLGASPFATPELSSLVRVAFPHSFKKGDLLGVVASKDEAPVGVAIFLRRAGAIGYYNAGFSDEHAQIGLGTEMMLYAFRQAIEERLSLVDLFRGDLPYKLRWSTRVRNLLFFGLDGSGKSVDPGEIVGDFVQS